MLLDRVIAAHGGLDLWQQIRRLKIRGRIGGNILSFKFQSPFTRSLEFLVDTTRFSIQLTPFPQVGMSGCFDGHKLTLIDQAGTTIKTHDVVRDKDGNVINRLIWTDLDLLYFFAYALWNYSVTPFLFLWPGFTCQELSPWSERDGVSWQRLKVVYPSAFPTHCREQIFYFNDQNLLCRLDYTADIFNRLARGAHYCHQHKNFDGLIMPTHRVVYLRNFVERPIRILPAAMEGWIDNVELMKE